MAAVAHVNGEVAAVASAGRRGQRWRDPHWAVCEKVMISPQLLYIYIGGVFVRAGGGVNRPYKPLLGAGNATTRPYKKLLGRVTSPPAPDNRFLGAGGSVTRP